DRRISLGDVVLLLTYVAMLARPAGDLGATWVTLQEPIAGLRRAFSVLDRLDEAASGSAGVDPGKITRIEMRNASIAYADAPVVRDISFELCSGELTGIAGPSGAGKTTIISALPRFIEPCSGALLINGIDIRQVNGDILRKRIGFVFQQEALFARSIADNIRYGLPEASDAQVHEAARVAGAADFIEALPGRYETMLGRRGARLSVGQKQRIAIARALLRNPDVIVLDEPTAPLDPSSEAALLRMLHELARDRIVVIVAHRVSTLTACDRIIFVENGSIVASGSHENLQVGCAAYREYLAVA
ncbi:MAG TPA: ABC transporter ATP-binding protein, partial [Candidatus Binataceae bacterium]|nr:ABC transporter ATP-binding protein [Candidatus Binataceae bacterium]